MHYFAPPSGPAVQSGVFVPEGWDISPPPAMIPYAKDLGQGFHLYPEVPSGENRERWPMFFIQQLTYLEHDRLRQKTTDYAQLVFAANKRVRRVIHGSGIGKILVKSLFGWVADALAKKTLAATCGT